MATLFTLDMVHDLSIVGISKPSDCIFPWDFNDKVQKEVYHIQ